MQNNQSDPDKEANIYHPIGKQEYNLVGSLQKTERNYDHIHVEPDKIWTEA